MPSNQESLYQVSKIVELVAEDLCSCLGDDQDIQYFEIVELVGRLDLVVDLIRHANGACC